MKVIENTLELGEKCRKRYQEPKRLVKHSTDNLEIHFYTPKIPKHCVSYYLPVMCQIRVILQKFKNNKAMPTLQYEKHQQ